MDVIGRILMEITGTMIMVKGSIGITGKVFITQWRKSELWFENLKVDSSDEFFFNLDYIILVLLKWFLVFVIHVFAFFCVFNEMFYVQISKVFQRLNYPSFLQNEDQCLLYMYIFAFICVLNQMFNVHFRKDFWFFLIICLWV